MNKIRGVADSAIFSETYLLANNIIILESLR